jgi:hypothetical protein
MTDAVHSPAPTLRPNPLYRLTWIERTLALFLAVQFVQMLAFAAGLMAGFTLITGNPFVGLFALSLPFSFSFLAVPGIAWYFAGSLAVAACHRWHWTAYVHLALTVVAFIVLLPGLWTAPLSIVGGISAGATALACAAGFFALRSWSRRTATPPPAP